MTAENDTGPSPSPERVRLPDWAAELLGTWDLEELRDLIVDADIEAAFPGRKDEPDFRRMLGDSVMENLANIRKYVIDPSVLAEFQFSSPMELARRNAEIGASHSAVLQSYRVGTAIQVEHGMALLQRRDGGSANPSDQLDVMTLFVQRSLAYSNFVLSEVSRAYEAEERALRQTGAQLRQELVASLLADDRTPLQAQVFASLSYDLSAAHVAVLVDGIDPGRLRDLEDELRRTAKATGVLGIRLRADWSAVWLSRVRGWSQDDIGAVVSYLWQSGLTALVSSSWHGEAGFRRAHEETKQMEKLRSVGVRMGRIAQFRDVRLEVMVGTEAAEVVRFVRDELGSLAEDHERAAGLRETLDASLRLGRHVAVAQELGLHEHTVRNRLQRAEQELGFPPAERRTEILLALRFRDSFAPRFRGRGPGR